ncbi:MAG TPA: hypothetical protein PLM75_08340, partial [bacterium]|nr:hypothetical protein [bacterium]
NADWDLVGYNIYRDTTGAGNYIKINNVIITDTQYFDTTALRGNTQYYAITALDKFTNQSVYSDSAGAANIRLNKYINSVTIGGETRPIKPGATVEFYIDYLNDGFAPADSVVLYDTILIATVDYKLNSADTVSGSIAAIKFSNNNGATWDYSQSGTLIDSNVTNVKWELLNRVYPQLTGISGRVKVSVVVK